VTDLATDLATLRLERRPPTARPWRWGVLLVVSVVLFAAVVYGFRARRPVAGVEVETIRALAAPNTRGGSSGATILTASGYLVARRKAVVSATIQGRLADLRVEEGSHVREGDIIARLESAEYKAHVERTRAAVQRAEAEYRRQFGLAENLGREGLVAVDQRQAAESRVRLAWAALRQAEAEFSVSQASLEHTRIRAPFTGTVIKKMAEVGESVAPIPPGLSISTSSGAIVVLADLNTLEVEADVSEVSLG
jgi:HlyD family secretion protein